MQEELLKKQSKKTLLLFAKSKEWFTQHQPEKLQQAQKL